MTLLTDNDDRLVLRFPADPENVALIRQSVSSQAATFGLRGEEMDDLKTVISEACANVVQHAYPSDAEQRPLEVEVTREREAMEVVVRDRGQGIQPHPGPKPSLRLGLALIGAMASCFQLRSARNRGTELSFKFPLPAT
jgi:serine/threonine-protein kinase RsbW